MSAPLHITERSVRGVIILDLIGRLVFEDGDERLRERVTALVKSGARSLLLDLKDVNYMDSAGIGVVVEMYLHVMRRGGRLKLLCPSPCAHRVLDITRLNTVMEIFTDEAEAVASFENVPA